MLFFPAIDIKDGKCVRLLQGEMDKATVFGDDPSVQAKKFADEGAEWIHIVDLNGAFAGVPVNHKAVEKIVKNVKVKLQLGGGIRDLDTVERWINAGIARVVLGTAALKNPELVINSCQKFPGRIAVGIDARDGMVAVEGWAKVSEIKAADLALKFEDAGVSAIIYTNIDNDGMMKGPDIEGTKKLAEMLTTKVILSGGISSIEDLRSAKKLDKFGVLGVISGRAIYENKFSVKEAIEVLK